MTGIVQLVVVGGLETMPRTSKTNSKALMNWFEGLSFDAQSAALTELAKTHAKIREKKISVLRKQLDELEGNGAAQVNGKRQGKSRKRASVKVKYRDPATGATWSGRGRMARWLAEKQKAGEKVTRYLVK
jgi:DNA-binding protein H-NS